MFEIGPISGHQLPESHESPESNHLSYSQIPGLEKSQITRARKEILSLSHRLGLTCYDWTHNEHTFAIVSVTDAMTSVSPMWKVVSRKEKTHEIS